MRINLICLIGDDFRGSVLEASGPAALIPLIEDRGFDYSHDSPGPQLQGWPVFNGLMGPFLHDCGGIRYEDDDAHEILTA